MYSKSQNTKILHIFNLQFAIFAANFKHHVTKIINNKSNNIFNCGPGGSVGIATGYGLDGTRIESRWGKGFPHQSRPALGPTQPLVQWVTSLSRG
jgi:hypothetical protein